MLSRGLDCSLQGWNAFYRVGIPLYRVGMLSTGLEYLCTESDCYVQGWNSFYRVGIPLYRVGIPLYRVGILSTGLEYLVQGWSAF
jgi:hypothetical protein